MAKHSTDFLLGSLKGRIWLAVSGLAIFNCICGLIAYLAASFFIGDPFFSIFVTFTLSAFTTLVFGWWLSNQVLQPIDRVGLVAKSLERSPAASIPRTTGASETDEVLETLSRNSRQLNTLIGMMDEVAVGRTDAAMKPLQNADRLSTSFQKLVAKVCESVNAKQELDDLLAAINKLTNDISQIKSGNLEVEIRTDAPQIKEVADTLRMLSGHLNSLIGLAYSNSTEVIFSVGEARKIIRAAAEHDEAKATKVERALSTLKDSPGRVKNAAGEIAGTLSSAENSFTVYDDAVRQSIENVKLIEDLRKKVNDVSRKIQNLRDHTLAIPQIAKSAEDVAKRSNLIALNTSLQGNDGAVDAASIASMGEEIGGLSIRADNMRKEISSMNEVVLREADSIESSLQSINEAVASFADQAAKNGGSINELGKHLRNFATIQSKFTAYAADQSSENEQLMKIISTVSSGGSGDGLRKSEEIVEKISRLMTNLKESLGDLRPNDPFKSFSGKVVKENDDVPIVTDLGTASVDQPIRTDH